MENDSSTVQGQQMLMVCGFQAWEKFDRLCQTEEGERKQTLQCESYLVLLGRGEKVAGEVCEVVPQ